MEQENVNQAEDNQQQVQATENIESSPVNYAGFWIRFVASFLDGLVLLVPNILINISFNLVMPEMIEKMASNILNIAISWAYFIYMTDRYQATFGKKWLGLKVVSENQERLSFNQIVLRETVGKLVSAFTLFIGYIMVAFTQKKQGLHDKIAGSVVIQES